MTYHTGSFLQMGIVSEREISNSTNQCWLVNYNNSKLNINVWQVPGSNVIIPTNSLGGFRQINTIFVL